MPMDVLSSILDRVKLKSAVYFKSDFPSPWGMDIPKGPFAQFHMVTKGRCVLSTKSGQIVLFEGDIVIFPLGNDHWLADDISSHRKNGQDVVKAIWNGKSLFEGPSVTTTLVCGHFEFDRTIDHQFIRELPEIIHITGSERKEISWLENVANLVVQETEGNCSGSHIITGKLGEILFVHALRAHVEKNASGKGFLAALQDKRIGRALQGIHDHPERNWQVATLAQLSGMSRTGFSNRFKNLVGATPLSYVTDWRIIRAKELLEQSKASVGEIAESVGYRSEAAFNRVFKKKVHQTPLKFRQNKLAS